jgi:prepilin-type N-terminal cleavage/methylation domain-containing protein
MKPLEQHGFSLMEMMVVMVVMGVLIAVTIPAYKHYTASHTAKAAAENITNQLSLARERAISTGQTQTIRFIKDFGGTSDYHIWQNSTAGPSWRLPRGVTYRWSGGTQNTFRMTSDGRCQDQGYIILESDDGSLDTVSVRYSGLVLAN